MVKWTSVMTQLLTRHIKDGCEWSKNGGNYCGKPTSDHLKFTMHWSCPFELKRKWFFVNNWKCKSMISMIEFLNMWQNGINDLNLTLVSHVSLWPSVLYLLNILCATKIFHKYFHADDNDGNSDRDGDDNDNQLYTSYLHLVSKWLVYLSDAQNVCVLHGRNVLHEATTYMPVACWWRVFNFMMFDVCCTGVLLSLHYILLCATLTVF